MIGETILHYKILEKLGEGGMGVVYKAQDIQLDRIVALKFLPHRVAETEKDKTRFIQEAKSAAALNHPNICTVHGIEQKDEDVFIVMEYVDGVTLRKKIEAAQLSINDAVTYATQIGEALQEAHSKGIVHRDVKSENIMLNSKNQIKVMDFGLAKLKGSMRLTRSASTVGTLAYMSPEQIQGSEVDTRSDIFSFAVVLYEMLTSRLPFRGEHDAAMMYSILNEEPEPVVNHRPEISSEIVYILGKALEKNPADRYQSINEMVVDLRRAKRETSSVKRPSLNTGSISTVTAAQPTTSSEIVQQKSGISKLIKGNNNWILAAIAVVVIGVAVFLLLQKGTPELNPDMTSQTIQMPFTVFQYPGLSPDGNWIVFPAADANNKWDIYWMHYSGGDARRVTFDSSAAPPPNNRILGASISPDGGQIAYNRFNPKDGSEICIVSSNGGIGREIANGVAAKWTPDGKRIGYVTGFNNKYRSIHSVKPDGTGDRIEYVDSIGTTLGNYDYAWSPDGKSIAWIRTFQSGYQEIITHNLKTDNEKQLTSDKKNIDEVFWAANNMIIFSSNKFGNTNLWCIPADGGKEQQITRGGGPDLGIVVSTDCKKLLYYQNQNLGYIWRADGTGTNLKQITFDDQNITSLCYSPDGQYIVFSATTDQGFAGTSSQHLYVMNKDGSNRRQLTFEDEIDQNPQFSPDGEHIAYASIGNLTEPPDSMKIKLIDFPATSEPRTIRTGFNSWWIDNSAMVVNELFKPGNAKVFCPSSWKVPVTGGKGVQLFQDSTQVYPIDHGKYTVFIDYRPFHYGLWLKNETSGTTRLLRGDTNLGWIISQSGFGYFVKPDGTLWKRYYPSGKEEKIPGKLSGITQLGWLVWFSVTFSADGKNIAFINRQSRGRLVLIDNPFK